MEADPTSPAFVPSQANRVGSDPLCVDRESSFDHSVQFYDSDLALCRAAADFLGKGGKVGETLAIFATPAHREGVCAWMTAYGFDVKEMCASGALLLVDVKETLDAFMVDGLPDAERFRARVGKTVLGLLDRSPNGRARVFGEMVDVLWAQGNAEATLALEKLWNELGRGRSLSVLCGYGVSGNDHQYMERLKQLCAAHQHVSDHEQASRGEAFGTSQDDVYDLQERTRALEREVDHRKRVEQALREALTNRHRTELELRGSQRELMDFFENAVEGLHSAGPDGVIISANRAELDMLGYTPQEYIGHRVEEFHVDQDVVADIFARLRRNETVKDCEAKLRCKDGTIKSVLIHSNAYFRGGRFIHTRCFTRDVSDRKKLEDDLRQQNEELMRAVRFSELFVGILGHDLRNPLSAIATAASLLRRRAESEKIQRPVARILNSTERMARMIDQLLDFTRVRLGKGLPIQRRGTDLRHICRVAIDELQAFDVDQRVQCQMVGESVGLWDADRLLQLVSNLVSNALVHGEPSGPVMVRIDGTHGEFVTLEVRNAGVVHADMMPVFFEPFRGASNEKQERSSGLGLGLFISHQIVLGHGGTMDVFSSEAEGTRLVVKLPRSSIPEKSAVH